MTSQLENQLQERVLPWLFSQVERFMVEDEQILQNAHEIAETSIRRPQQQHDKTLYNTTLAGKAKLAADKEAKLKDTQRKEERRRQREIRMKEQIKAVLKKEIMDNIVYKGDLKSPSTNFELMDLHGNYEDKKTLTTLGGHF